MKANSKATVVHSMAFHSKSDHSYTCILAALLGMAWYCILNILKKLSARDGKWLKWLEPLLCCLYAINNFTLFWYRIHLNMTLLVSIKSSIELIKVSLFAEVNAFLTNSYTVKISDITKKCSICHELWMEWPISMHGDVIFSQNMSRFLQLE